MPSQPQGDLCYTVDELTLELSTKFAKVRALQALEGMQCNSDPAQLTRAHHII